MPVSDDTRPGRSSSTRNTTLVLLLPLLVLTALTMLCFIALQQPVLHHHAVAPHFLLQDVRLRHRHHTHNHNTTTYIQRRRHALALEQQSDTVLPIENVVYGATLPFVSQDTPIEIQHAVLSFVDWVQRALAGSVLGLQPCVVHHVCLQAGHCLYWSMCTPHQGAPPTLASLLILPQGPPALSFAPRVVGGPDPASLLSHWEGGPGVVSQQGDPGVVEVAAAILMPVDAAVKAPSTPGSIPVWGGRRMLAYESSSPNDNSNTIIPTNTTTNTFTLLNGSLAFAIASMSDIRALHISGVQLQGHLPAVWGGALPILAYVNVSNNMLTGSLPETYSKLGALQILDVSNNALTGPVPLAWSNVTNLYFIDASSNAMCTVDAFDLQQHTRAVFVDTRNQTPAEGFCGGLGGGGSLVQGGSGGGSQVRAPSSRQDVVVECKHGGLDNAVLMMLAIALAAAAIVLLGSVMLFAAHRAACRRRLQQASTSTGVTPPPVLVQSDVPTEALQREEAVSDGLDEYNEYDDATTIAAADGTHDMDDDVHAIPDHAHMTSNHPAHGQHAHVLHSQHPHALGQGPHAHSAHTLSPRSHNHLNGHHDACAGDNSAGPKLPDIPYVVLQPDGLSICLASTLTPDEEKEQPDAHDAEQHETHASTEEAGVYVDHTGQQERQGDGGHRREGPGEEGPWEEGSEEQSPLGRGE